MQTAISVTAALIFLCSGFSSCECLGQELYGVTVGMTPDEMCRYVNSKPVYSFRDPATGCPGSDDNASVDTIADPTLSSLVHIVFHEGMLATMWIEFLPGQFEEFHARAVKKYGSPLSERTVVKTNGLGARFQCRQTFWRTKTTIIELDQRDDNDARFGTLTFGSRAREEAARKRSGPKF
jgi:hypothetical protein